MGRGTFKVVNEVKWFAIYHRHFVGFDERSNAYPGTAMVQMELHANGRACVALVQRIKRVAASGAERGVEISTGIAAKESAAAMPAQADEEVRRVKGLHRYPGLSGTTP